MGIEGILRQQGGVIDRAQAVAAGLSAAAISARVATGRWRSLHRGVYLATDHTLTHDARLRAAILWAGATATLSGLAAAWWHGLWPTLPDRIEITVPRRCAPRSTVGLRVRRRDLHPNDRTKHRNLPVTAIALTVLEASVALGEHGSALLDRALQGQVEYRALLQAHNRNLGRHGSVKAAGLLAAAADRNASHAERIMITLLRGAALTGWVRGHPVGGYLLDFAFVARRIAIEADGWAWHSDVARFRRDRQRQNALVLAGWTVLRFTWHDLTQRPAIVIAEIRAALTRSPFGHGSA